MHTPLPRPLVPLKEGGGYALLRHGVDEPLDIGCSGVSGGGIDCVGRQDGGVAAVEVVGLGAGEIVPVFGLRKEKAQKDV